MTGLEILLALLLVAANGFFVATEFSLTRTRPTQVDDWLRERRVGAKSVKHGVDHIDAYLAACQLGITVSSLGLGVVGERAFHDLLDGLFGEESEVVGFGVAAVIAFLIITMLHVVLGELSPKSLAIARTRRTVLWVTPLMRAFYLATKPLVDAFNWLGNLVLKPFGIPPAREAGHDPLSERELRAILRESQRGGLIERDERTFTENVLTFGDRRAREVMVPRHRVQFVTADMSLEEVIDQIRATGLTRLPLCEPGAGLDAALGVVHAKALLTRNPDQTVADLVMPVERVPESMLIDELLEQLRKRREHIALVVDEHGTVVGIITLEDVLEEIVGEIEDEYDPERGEPLVREEGGTTLIAGSAPLRLVAEALETEIEGAHEATIGGHILEELGRPPEPGEIVQLDNLRLEVLEAGEAQIVRLRVAGRNDTEEEEED